MEEINKSSFTENKNRLAEIYKLGKLLEAETDPEKIGAIKKEIAEKGDALKASLYAAELADRDHETI